MTCKAKAMAGGFEALYKRWRPDERAKGKKNKLNERQGAKKTGGGGVFHVRAQENAEMGDEKGGKVGQMSLK